MSTAKEFSRFVASGPVPEATLERAAPLVIATLGVTLAGGREPGVKRLASTLIPADDPGRVRSF